MSADPHPERPPDAEFLGIAEVGYRRGRAAGLEHHDAQDIASEALAKLLSKLPHPNPSALYHKIWHDLFVDHLRRQASADATLDRLRRELRPEDEAVQDRFWTASLQTVRRLCEKAGLAVGSVLWRVTLHKALGDSYADMAASWPGTTKDSWRKAWSRAAPLLRAALDEDEDLT